MKNLEESFSLPKYNEVRENIGAATVVDELPWTPARYRKFKDAMEAELHLPSDYAGTVINITNDLSDRYTHRFFSEVWQPRTNDYDWSGWRVAEQINELNPQSVLDVGCGYHPFKNRIQNVVGIDPYNDAADYMVDILEYKVKPESHDHIIALGSINFNSHNEIAERIQHCVSLLKTGGTMWMRVNPGIPHKTGPYVDIFPWSFEVVNEFSEQFNLELMEFKKDRNERLYFVWRKN